MGERAKKHTENFLKSGFTVHTTKQEARSASGQNRYYADPATACARFILAEIYSFPNL